MKDSPLWWLFALISVLIWFSVMLPAMPTRKYKALVSLGPVLAFVPLVAYCLKYGEPLVKMLPI